MHETYTDSVVFRMQASSEVACCPHEFMIGNSLMRILDVAAFAVSGYASTEGRICKPFNPLLGETYEADYPNKEFRFFFEKLYKNLSSSLEDVVWKTD